MVGTPYYNGASDRRGSNGDVYAFGILLYELMAGAHPITAATMERIFYAILNEAPDLAENAAGGLSGNTVPAGSAVHR